MAGIQPYACACDEAKRLAQELHGTAPGNLIAPLRLGRFVAGNDLDFSVS
jgi:hypothetical protein